MFFKMFHAQIHSWSSSVGGLKSYASSSSGRSMFYKLLSSIVNILNAHDFIYFKATQYVCKVAAIFMPNLDEVGTA